MWIFLSGHSPVCLSRTEHFLLSVGRGAYPCYHCPKILQIKEDMGCGTLFCLFIIHNGALLPDSQNGSV